LALSMSSCKCSISTFRAFRRVNIVLYLQWDQRTGRVLMSESHWWREGCAWEAWQCCPGAGNWDLTGAHQGQQMAPGYESIRSKRGTLVQ
jgi:hypothetical protein